MKRFKFTQEMKTFLTDNVNGMNNKSLTELFNKEFNVNICPQQLKNYKTRNKLSSGLTGQFFKGNIPHNKGKQVICAPGTQKAWFKEGNVPVNYRSVGSERTICGEYVQVKIQDPNKWEFKHRVIYSLKYGEIPENHTVIFLDKNKNNFNIENLKLISRRELLMMNQNAMFSANAEMTECCNQVAKLMIRISDKKKGV